MKPRFALWLLCLALFGVMPTGVCSEVGPSPGIEGAFVALEKAVKEGREKHQESSGGWKELERFQTALWRAMALDPAPGAAVPVREVPKELFAAELNQDLRTQFEALEKSPIPEQSGAGPEFKQYLATAGQILSLRESRQFPQARAIAKRGILDHDFKPLLTRVHAIKDPAQAAPAWHAIEEGVRTLKEQVYPKDPQKRDLINSGNQFIWYTVVAFLGFFVGVLGIRVKPDFFQRFTETLESAAPATGAPSGSSHALDYALWLKELEEILNRLRSSQIGHERRIEDMVQQADQMVQHAQGLAVDARIKNEPNLDFRMSGLVKQLRTQMEHGQKLKSGDRVQITMMMEHCLKLCDAVEAGAIHYDRTRPESPPTLRSA